MRYSPICLNGLNSLVFNVEGHLKSNLKKGKVSRSFQTLDLVSSTRMDKALDIIRVNFKTEKSLDQRMAGRVNGN